ncbi:MAG: CarD family transcriptional regulator [Bacillota bacterium]|nr:CarD family transcriptional regulator [Bacillota bacterium]
MFAIGDKVLYPLHGAGVIEQIEDKEILGKKQKYYIMKLMLTGMSVMIPTNAKEVGLRKIIDSKTAKSILKDFSQLTIPLYKNWNQRYRENLNKMRSGNPKDVAAVVKSLMDRDLKRGLSTGERRMLISARQIITSEFALATGLSEGDISSVIDSSFEVRP